MKITMSIDPQANPNAAGELLRSQFFKAENGKTCGYNAVDWAKDVEELRPQYAEWDDPTDEWAIPYRCARKDDIVCKMAFDHDMDLQFHFSDGSVLRNDDAKKDYNWRFYTAKEWKTHVNLTKDGLDLD